MSLEVSPTNKTRKIMKPHNHKLVKRRKKTLIKSQLRSSISEKLSSQPTEEQSNVNLNYYNNYNPYTLGYFNSISFCQGKIYDFLQLKTTPTKTNDNLQANCSSSSCLSEHRNSIQKSNNSSKTQEVNEPSKLNKQLCCYPSLHKKHQDSAKTDSNEGNQGYRDRCRYTPSKKNKY